MALSIGIDIGSISLKVAVLGLGEEGRADTARLTGSDGFWSPAAGPRSVDGNSYSLALSRYRRLLGRPLHTLDEVLRDISRVIPRERLQSVTVTGSGGKLAGGVLSVPFVNEFKAIAKGFEFIDPDVRTVFEMGGESSKFLRLEYDGDSRSLGIVDFEKNGDCAAGTGSFIDQQAARLRFTVEEVGEIALGSGKAAAIAGRCSVFAKSDMIHAQQKGFSPAAILKGLCAAVARNFKGTVVKGKQVEPPVAFIGGVSRNAAVVQALEEAFGMQPGDLRLPEAYAWTGAVGASLLAMEDRAKKTPPALEELQKAIAKTHVFSSTEPLSMENVVLLREKVPPYVFPDTPGPVDAFLGVDIGSVSTNLVAIDEKNAVMHEIYLRTEGRPIEVVGKGLEEIEEKLGARIRIRGVATTGSGRELIGELIGADAVHDEITAHKTGSAWVADKYLGETVDTIFEIGGQDSKFISLKNGVVVDFTMNEACAAGTGSFLEEQAEKLGISIYGEFARLALGSRTPMRLGERCTVFMEKDVNGFQLRGARKEDISAGLAYSIALNYLNRVVRGRKVGDHIYFQGGTAYNDAVAAAFAKILGKRITVPPHNGVLGALGAAMLAKEKVQSLSLSTTFRGYRIDAIDRTVREFTCKGCTNYCDVQEFTIEGKKSYWGDKCSERYRKASKVDKIPVVEDLIALRSEMLLRDFHEGKKGKGARVGYSRGMYFFELFPFWNRYLADLDFEVVLSDETDKEIRESGIGLCVSEPCFPIQIAHGHLKNLIGKKVDHLFVQNVLNMETADSEVQSQLCPWGQTLAFVLRSVPAIEPHAGQFMIPTVHFRQGRAFVLRELAEFAGRYGISRKVSDGAAGRAFAVQEQFMEELRRAGAQMLSRVEAARENAVILIGRPYNIYDKGANIDLPSKLRKIYGVNVIPIDFLSVDGEDIGDLNPNMYWSYGAKIIRTARFTSRHPHLHVIYITNFKCGPDSFIKHFAAEAAGKPFLTLQFDAHSNDAGMMTRVEAYLDSKGILRWWKKDQKIA